MERLLRSSYPTPFRIQVKPSPFSPRLGRVHSLKPNLPSPTCSELTRVDSISSKHEDPSPFSSPSSERVFNLQILSSSGADSAKGSVPQSDSHDSGKKATALGRITLLFALATIVINPILAPRAFAGAGKGLMRAELLSSAWTGFLAGCLHTLSGPDHLAALAPLSIGRTKIESAAVGALWGCGHDTGQLIFGLIFLFLKHRLHIEVIRIWGTRVVGLTLLVIGAMGIREASEYDLAHENPTRAVKPKKKKEIGLATFATGIVHGLQPDALMMVLPALALPSRVAGAAFLGMFLLGTVIAMGSYTVFIGSCSEALKDRVPRITEKLTWVSSLIAIGLGFAIIISQYFGYSLY